MQLNLDQIRALIEVIECGGFTAAAQRLNLTQPAVSLQVQELESRYRLSLVERVGRRVRPTAAGRELAAIGQKLLDQADEAQRLMRRFSDGFLGQVRLGMSMTSLIYLMPPVIRELKANAPLIELVIRTDFSEATAQSVRDNEIDIGLCIGPVGGRLLDITDVGVDRLVAVFPADARDVPDAVDAAAIRRWPLVLSNPRSALRRLVDGWLAEAGPLPRPVMELDNVAAIKCVVGAGVGAAVVPEVAMRPDEVRRDFLMRPLAPPVERKTVLVQRAHKRDDPAFTQVKVVLLGHFPHSE